MRVGVIGSRDINCDFYPFLCYYIPKSVSEIVSGGADGADTLAAQYAHQNSIHLTEFLPEYSKYGRRATLVRNDLIVDNSEYILAFWDGKSRGTAYTIKKCIEKQLPIRILLCNEQTLIDFENDKESVPLNPFGINVQFHNIF